MLPGGAGHPQAHAWELHGARDGGSPTIAEAAQQADRGASTSTSRRRDPPHRGHARRPACDRRPIRPLRDQAQPDPGLSRTPSRALPGRRGVWLDRRERACGRVDHRRKPPMSASSATATAAAARSLAAKLFVLGFPLILMDAVQLPIPWRAARSTGYRDRVSGPGWREGVCTVLSSAMIDLTDGPASPPGDRRGRYVSVTLIDAAGGRSPPSDRARRSAARATSSGGTTLAGRAGAPCRRSTPSDMVWAVSRIVASEPPTFRRRALAARRESRRWRPAPADAAAAAQPGAMAFPLAEQVRTLAGDFSAPPHLLAQCAGAHVTQSLRTIATARLVGLGTGARTLAGRRAAPLAQGFCDGLGHRRGSARRRPARPGRLERPAGRRDQHAAIFRGALHARLGVMTRRADPALRLRRSGRRSPARTLPAPLPARRSCRRPRRLAAGRPAGSRQAPRLAPAPWTFATADGRARWVAGPDDPSAAPTPTTAPTGCSRRRAASGSSRGCHCPELPPSAAPSRCPRWNAWAPVCAAVRPARRNRGPGHQLILWPQVRPDCRGGQRARLSHATSHAAFLTRRGSRSTPGAARASVKTEHRSLRWLAARSAPSACGRGTLRRNGAGRPFHPSDRPPGRTPRTGGQRRQLSDAVRIGEMTDRIRCARSVRPRGPAARRSG